MNGNDELAHLLVRRALGASEGVTEGAVRAVLVSAFRQLANVVYVDGRDQLGDDDDHLYRMRQANTDGWLDDLANVLAVKS